MLRSFIAKLRDRFHREERRESVSVLLPLLIISAGLGVLAWRSYELSLRMERGANTLAVQYAGYAAEITARRVDAAVRAELSRASEEWQQLERRKPEPDSNALRDWINSFDWVVSAIYVPDIDPASSIFISELGPKSQKPLLTREFPTSSGTVRYSYDPERLLTHVHAALRQQPLIRTSDAPDTLAIQQRAEIAIVSTTQQQSMEKLDDGFAFVSPLSPPLASWGVQATVRTASYVGSGWENQRVVSLSLSLLALLLMGSGAYLATRGLKKEAETMKLRGALIANVSHELRTPLSMIRLGAETLSRAKKLSPAERQQIEQQILHEVLHLSHLVENVLDVARIQHRSTKALAFTPVFPRDLVRTLVTTYDSWFWSKGFVVSTEIDDAVGEQLWDREAVSRALLNLIDNAIKYSADDKRIDVILRQTEQHVIIEVKDHGIGIDAKDLQRIFDPYFRAQFSDTQTRRGAGLGLTLVQQIVASHGGKVDVESELGRGSCFRLSFPQPGTADAAEVSAALMAREAF